MPEARPDADELLETVTEFLHHISKHELSGQAAFHARVAANALVIARREWSLRADMDAGEVARLTAILGHDGGHGGLNRELAERLRGGDATLDQSQTLDHLRQVVRDKLVISNPKYLSAADRAAVDGGS